MFGKQCWRWGRYEEVSNENTNYLYYNQRDYIYHYFIFDDETADKIYPKMA